MIIWLASYPRSGNTLLRIILKSVFDRSTYSKHDDTNDIGADSRIAEEVGHQFLGATWQEAYGKMQSAQELYLVKTHDAPEDSGKAIYVVRDGRSSCRSFFHYLRDYPYLAFEFSVRDVVAGFTPFGSWGGHLDNWQPMSRPDTLLIKYEDLVSDPAPQIQRIAEFTGLAPQHDWQNNFDRLHEMNPKFFRAGTSNDPAGALDGEDSDIFWSEHGDWMQRLGYPQPSSLPGDPRVNYRQFISTKGMEYFTLLERAYVAEQHWPSVQAEVEQVKSRTLELKRQLEESEAESSQIRRDNERLKVELASLVSVLSSRDTELDTLKTVMDADRLSTAELRSTLTASAEGLKIKQAELHAQLEEERDRAARQVQQSTESIIALNVELDAARTALEDSRCEVAAARSDLENARQELQTQQQQAEGQKKELEVFVQQLNSTQQKLESTAADLTGERERAAAMSSQLQQSQRSLADAQAAYDSIAQRVRELEAQLSGMRNDLTWERSKSVDVQRRLDEASRLADAAEHQHASQLAEKSKTVDVLAGATKEMNNRLRMLLGSRFLRLGWRLGFGRTPYWADPSQDDLANISDAVQKQIGSNGATTETLHKIIELVKQAPPKGDEMDDALQHLVDKGFRPAVVADIGSAKGYWTLNAAWRWKDAEFFMIDPLKESEGDLKKICQDPRFHYILTAVGKVPGELIMNVTPDCDGSSLLEFPNPDPDRQRRVPIETIDRLIESGKIKSPQLVKIDVQGFELNALDGGQKLFETAEVFIIEVNFIEFMQGCPRVHDVVKYMADRGFFAFDFAGFLRRPYENDLGQTDLVFVKQGHPMVASTRWA